MRINVKSKTEQEWLEFRNKQGIGASEFGPIMGLDKWCPAMKVFNKKVGVDKDLEVNEFTETGKIMEAMIADLWKYWKEGMTKQDFWEAHHRGEKQRTCQRTPYIYVSDENPFIFASPDRLFFEEGKGWGVLEIKKTSTRALKEPKAVNPTYIFQIQQQLYCTGLQFGEMCVYLEDTHELIVFRFERDEEVIQSIISVCTEFWNNVLAARESISNGKNYSKFLPTADKTEAYREYVKEKVPVSPDAVMDGTQDDYLNCLEYRSLKEQQREIDEKVTEVTNNIRGRMIFTEELIDGDTGLPVVEQRHFAEIRFVDDPNSYVKWNKKSNGYDNFSIHIAAS